MIVLSMLPQSSVLMKTTQDFVIMIMMSAIMSVTG